MKLWRQDQATGDPDRLRIRTRFGIARIALLGDRSTLTTAQICSRAA